MLNFVITPSIYRLGGTDFGSLFFNFGLLSLQNKMCRLKRRACRIVSAQRSETQVRHETQVHVLKPPIGVL